MFQNARDAPVPQTLMQRARMGDNRIERASIAAVFEHGMGVGLGNISERGAIAINPAAAQVLRDQPTPQPKQPFRLGRGGLIQRRRKFEPMRRAKTRHPPPFLIYHHRCMPAHGRAQICAESVSYTHLTLPTICSV